MKILAIRGKNLASLEDEFNVDFTQEPLKSAGIYAITGCTGAGKSTILDALCLALFDDAPRLREAEATININDVEDKTITQKDSRNILRRGASDGYAEVDFIAPNGDTYRSRWMVRRARGIVSGALQQTVVKLENLSTGAEESGTKTDLLNKISKIVGLSFGQFTRAVLLAQGDFANFLKAKQNEKAELLEKLTGTEVYSKISMLIFQKTGEAKNNLQIIQQRIKDIKLLTDTELDNFIVEKTKLTEEIKPLKGLQSDTEKKLNWIKQEEILKQDIDKAENNLKSLYIEIQEASPRYKYISFVDQSQEIRDIYIAWDNKQRQIDVLQNNLNIKKPELESVILQIQSLEQKILTAKNNIEVNENNFRLAKPEIEKAKQLDIKIQAAQEKATEAQKEFDLQSVFKIKISDSVQNTKNKIEEAKSAVKTLNIWFADRESYKLIVPRTDFFVNILNDAQFAKQQIINASNTLKSTADILVTFKENLKNREEEAERLNMLLPVQIVNLRAKLEEGKPCPVCGSLHHAVNNLEQKNSIDEKELEKAKETVSNSILALKGKIEFSEKEKTQQETLINNYNLQYNNAISKVEKSFHDSKHWKENLETGELQKKLLDFAKKWNESEEKLNSYQKLLELLTAKLDADNNSFVNICTEYTRKKELWENSKSAHESIVKERSFILAGKDVTSIEATYNKQKEEFNKIYEQEKELRNKLEKNKSEINGFLSQIENELETHTSQVNDLYNSVKNWTENPAHQITLELLKDIMYKPREWVTKEKDYLSNLKNNELVLNTTLKERTERFNKHLEAEEKPADKQSKDSILVQLANIAERADIINKKLIEIEVILAKHNDSREQIISFGQELKSKEELYDNWAKLNDLLGSAKGHKFKAIAQGYTLDVLLSYANKHLENLTKQYKLEKTPNSLALQVIDNYQLGEIRSIHTLSGGESFLISLSLALGLSSLSSNRMKIESLFIDEGFGSLDIDTLNIAIDALENLQTQGRKIGVISHVAEMTERIATKIQVVKYANGKSKIEIPN